MVEEKEAEQEETARDASNLKLKMSQRSMMGHNNSRASLAGVSRLGSIEDISIEIDSDLSIDASDLIPDVAFGAPILPTS